MWWEDDQFRELADTLLIFRKLIKNIHIQGMGKNPTQNKSNQWPRNVKADSAFPESKLFTAVTFTEMLISFWCTNQMLDNGTGQQKKMYLGLSQTH